jgi:hypothetical protein
MAEKVLMLRKKPALVGRIYTINADGTVRFING